jgi:glycosyltransferase involved in cell wall biosynthesis
MRVLAWHVHGSWMTAFVQGSHDYLVPVLPDRGPDGLGRARTWDWPDSVVEVAPDGIAAAGPDVVVLQRPEEAAVLEAWTGLRAGVDLPAVYVEHNTPRGDVDDWRHPLAGQTRIPVVHVTTFNQAMWDNGSAPTYVIDHGVIDPGPLWSGEEPRLAMSVNEPVRRWRVAGMDLAAAIAKELPVDVYGMGSAEVVRRDPSYASGRHEDLTQADLHARMASHRAYLHMYRWTSLGLSLIEAMMLGSPVLVLAATAAAEAVPAGGGLVSSDVSRLLAEGRRLVDDPDAAASCGRVARNHALQNFGVQRFLQRWDDLLGKVC